MFTKILVAYDGSELAKKALQMAIQFSKKNPNLQIDVIHVYQIPTIAIADGIYTPSAKQALQYYENAEKVLEEAKKIAEEQSVNINAVLKEGIFAKNIVDYADEAGCDVILIGSRGLSGLKEMFLGSVSHNVVQKANVPVLIVKLKI
ncbi:universal stress protein [Calidifontibacillus erzurumensis]|uniref:Universal stress protein n=2 Tax=Calidifontibacillus erzurumensis TaxID=2741433 RepID=A0A8J8GBG4_9BACI|nr:universal stress protein [Calidifontibacillus erzurumensis]NSL50612.1 universal stress protein [Calidifontibacillus erzurumensis]